MGRGSRNPTGRMGKPLGLSLIGMKTDKRRRRETGRMASKKDQVLSGMKPGRRKM
jgi:hypothetical protein